MFCPICRYEYRPEITKCPDCDTWLVSALPEEVESENQPDDVEPVLIYSTLDQTKSLMAEAMLEDAGILHETTNSPNYGSPTPFADVSLHRPFEIYVRPEDVERATEILETLEVEGESAADLPDSDTGSDNDSRPL